MGGGAGRITTIVQIQQGSQISAHRDRRVIEICLGRALENKMGKSVAEAFAKILKRANGRKPQNFQTDDGKEFYNKIFAALMKQKDIHHFSTAGDTKGSTVERLNRTLKERMYRYFTIKNTLSYLPILPALLKGYNGSYHRSIGMAPEQVNTDNEKKVWDRLYAKKLSGKKHRWETG